MIMDVRFQLSEIKSMGIENALPMLKSLLLLLLLFGKKSLVIVLSL